MPSSAILRVMVLRPMPSRLAASMRRPAGALERLGDERALELTRESIEDPGLAARETPLGLVLERGKPVGAGGRRLVAELRRQVSGIDHLSRRHHREPVAQVLELAHVAGKLEPREVRERIVGQPLGLDAELPRARGEEVPREQRNVLARARAGSAAAGGSRSGGGTDPRGTMPSRTRCSRFWCVAAITRTLALIGWWPPTR